MGEEHVHEEYTGLPGDPGYYALVIRLDKEITVRTRGGRRFLLKPGLYVYIGSARGPGGVKARVERHMRRDKKPFWHIDYVTINPASRIMAVVSVPDPGIDVESRLAAELSEKLVPVKGFGASDKRRDTSHLYHCPGLGVDECIDLLYNVLFGILAEEERRARSYRLRL